MSVRFSAGAERAFTDIVGRYPKKEAALLPVLWLAQREFGSLTPEVRAYVAKRLEVSLARVESVVSFYSMYETGEPAQHHMAICRNLSCMLRGCGSLMEVVEKDLNLRDGERSADGRFKVSTVECLAACGGAPAIRIDDTYHENMDPAALRDLILKLKESGGKDR